MLIEKGIPLPQKGKNGSMFYGMEVGDSLFFAEGFQPKISAACASYGRAHGQKYTTRKVDGGVRAWRVA